MAKLKNLMEAPLTVGISPNKSMHFKVKEVISVPDSYLESPEVKIKIKRGILMVLAVNEENPPQKGKIKK